MTNRVARPGRRVPVILVAPALLTIALLSACSDTDSPPSAATPTEDAPAPSAPVASPTPALDAPPAPEQTAPSGFAREPLTIVTAAGQRVTVSAEIADSAEERALGLMGRTALDPDAGMLFVFQSQPRGFWMKDTLVPLTVAFIAACGEIVDFADLEPLSEEVRNTDEEYRFALEMERGWFTGRGIAAGDVVEIPERLLSESC